MGAVIVEGCDKRLVDEQECCILIIDVQERLFPLISDKERIRDRIVRLIRFSKIMDLPIILTEQENLGETIPEIRVEMEDFAPIMKIDFNCFGSRDFTGRIEDTDKKVLIVAGIETHICVAQTAIYALSGHRVQLLTDCTSCRSKDDKEIALKRMAGCGVTLTTSEMFFYELLKKAGTDKFREVLRLVK